MLTVGNKTLEVELEHRVTVHVTARENIFTP